MQFRLLNVFLKISPWLCFYWLTSTHFCMFSLRCLNRTFKHIVSCLNIFLVLNRVKAKLEETAPDRVEPFMANAQAEVKKIIANIKNYQVCSVFSQLYWSSFVFVWLYDDYILRTPLEDLTNETNTQSEYGSHKLQTCLFCIFFFLLTFFFLLQFFTGESMNPDGTIGLLDFREDGVTPFMLFFKDGLEIEKCVSWCIFVATLPNYTFSRWL